MPIILIKLDLTFYFRRAVFRVTHAKGEYVGFSRYMGSEVLSVKKNVYPGIYNPPTSQYFGACEQI